MNQPINPHLQAFIASTAVTPFNVQTDYAQYKISPSHRDNTAKWYEEKIGRAGYSLMVKKDSIVLDLITVRTI